jgi:hypothetical protein
MPTYDFDLPSVRECRALRPPLQSTGPARNSAQTGDSHHSWPFMPLPLRVSNHHQERIVRSHDELRDLLSSTDHRGGAAFWLASPGHEFPCMAIRTSVLAKLMRTTFHPMGIQASGVYLIALPKTT